MIIPSIEGPVERGVIGVVEWLRLGIDAAGALVLGGGVTITLGGLLASSMRGRRPDFTSLRLSLARYLALALELQLGADILSTAVAPTWDQIGKLGAVAAIRTGLNFFLMRELREAGEMPARRALPDGLAQRRLAAVDRTGGPTADVARPAGAC